MARLQDFQTVIPTSSDKLLVVQSQGQGLVPYGSKLDSANPTGTGSLSLNRKANTTVGDYSVAEGYNATASGNNSHAEGNNTTASGLRSHTEGSGTTASGDYGSHAEGYNSTASGRYGAHAEGSETTASGNYSHAEGNNTISNHRSQHVFGEYNTADASTAAATAKGNYIEIVGNGTTDTNRSNARTLDWSGNETLAGDLTINGSTSVGAGLKWGFCVPSTTESTVKINCGSNYKVLIIMGIFQQVGVKCFIVNISGGVLATVKDLVTGDPFTNVTNLSFAFANQVLTITCNAGSHFNVYGEDITRDT